MQRQRLGQTIPNILPPNHRHCLMRIKLPHRGRTSRRTSTSPLVAAWDSKDNSLCHRRRRRIMDNNRPRHCFLHPLRTVGNKDKNKNRRPRICHAAVVEWDSKHHDSCRTRHTCLGQCPRPQTVRRWRNSPNLFGPVCKLALIRAFNRAFNRPCPFC